MKTRGQEWAEFEVESLKAERQPIKRFDYGMFVLYKDHVAEVERLRAVINEAVRLMRRCDYMPALQVLIPECSAPGEGVLRNE